MSFLVFLHFSHLFSYFTDDPASWLTVCLCVRVLLSQNQSTLWFPSCEEQGRVWGWFCQESHEFECYFVYM